MQKRPILTGLFTHLIALACLAICFRPTALALDPKHQLTQYVQRIWQAPQGLSQTSILEVIQTSDGYIWLGTQNGVVRFDGVRFTPLPQMEAAGLGDAWVRQMVEDDSGNVWMVTGIDYRLIRVDKNEARVFPGGYSCVTKLLDGTAIACTEDGIAKLGSGEPQLIHAAAHFGGRHIAACQSRDGTIWLGGGQLLTTYDGSQFLPRAIKSVPADMVIRTVECAADTVWVGTGEGLVRIRGKEEKLYTTRDGLAANVVLTLAKGANEILWVGTRDGYSRFAQGKFESFGYRDGLSQNAVYALYEDREGSLWVGTGYGLNQFADGSATRFTEREGLPRENMGPVFQDRAGRLWAGALDGGLAYLDGNRFRPIKGTDSAKVIALTDTPDGALWAGTTNGLLRFQNGEVKAIYTLAQGLPSSHIRSLFSDRAGTLWVGTEKGPSILQTDHFVQMPSFIGMDLPVVGITQAGNGDMLVALERGGLWDVRGSKPRKIDGGGQTPFMDINAIFTDPQGVTWIGTNGSGLGILRNGVLTRIFYSDGLPDREVYGFLTDAKDRIWMAGSKGFFWSKRTDLLNFVRGKGAKIRTASYLPQEGLRAIQATSGVQPVASNAGDGRLWFTTTRGLLAFELNAGVQHPPPPVAIEDVLVNGAEAVADGPLALGPGQVNLALSYTALTFLRPQATQFRYMLEGFDRDWVQAGTRREAFYTNLPPGNFRFRVAACSDDFPCSEASSPLSLQIAPSFYGRAWFVPLLVLGLFGISWFVYRMRMRQVRSQFGLVLAERSRIARELHDTLIQGFSGITMQLQALTARLNGPEQRATLEEIIREAGTCLQETRRSVAGLRAGVGASAGLGEAIASVARQVTDHPEVRLKLDLDDAHSELPAEVKYNLVCIAQEAITNCLKHAEARNIAVRLSQQNGKLRLSIEDDGKGLILQPRAEGHYGMVGMRERASQIGAHFSVDSTPGKGTAVTVLLPVTKEARNVSTQPSLKAAS